MGVGQSRASNRNLRAASSTHSRPYDEPKLPRLLVAKTNASTLTSDGLLALSQSRLDSNSANKDSKSRITAASSVPLSESLPHQNNSGLTYHSPWDSECIIRRQFHPSPATTSRTNHDSPVQLVTSATALSRTGIAELGLKESNLNLSCISVSTPRTNASPPFLVPKSTRIDLLPSTSLASCLRDASPEVDYGQTPITSRSLATLGARLEAGRGTVGRSGGIGARRSSSTMIGGGRRPSSVVSSRRSGIGARVSSRPAHHHSGHRSSSVISSRHSGIGARVSSRPMHHHTPVRSWAPAHRSHCSPVRHHSPVYRVNSCSPRVSVCATPVVLRPRPTVIVSEPPVVQSTVFVQPAQQIQQQPVVVQQPFVNAAEAAPSAPTPVTTPPYPTDDGSSGQDQQPEEAAPANPPYPEEDDNRQAEPSASQDNRDGSRDVNINITVNAGGKEQPHGEEKIKVTTKQGAKPEEDVKDDGIEDENPTQVEIDPPESPPSERTQPDPEDDEPQAAPIGFRKTPLSPNRSRRSRKDPPRLQPTARSPVQPEPAREGSVGFRPTPSDRAPYPVSNRAANPAQDGFKQGLHPPRPVFPPGQMAPRPATRPVQPSRQLASTRSSKKSSNTRSKRGGKSQEGKRRKRCGCC